MHFASDGLISVLILYYRNYRAKIMNNLVIYLSLFIAYFHHSSAIFIPSASQYIFLDVTDR